MAHIPETSLDAGENFYLLFVIAGMKKTDGAQGIVHGIQRNIFFRA